MSSERPETENLSRMTISAPLFMHEEMPTMPPAEWYRGSAQ
jgi:hypothetical protein